MTLPDITILALGGTIASAPSSAGKPARMELDAESILLAVPEAGQLASIKPETFRQTGSADLAFMDIVELAARIRAEVESGAKGVVVTQGTDTLEETAFLLDRLLWVDIPVVMTGAMRHSGKTGEDGPANLLAALQVAACSSAKDCGVVVVINNEIHLARFVQKAHSTSVSAFTSLPLGPVGYISEDRVQIPLKPCRQHRKFDLDVNIRIPKVALIPLIFDGSNDVLEHVMNADYEGAVVQAFGAGHVNSRHLDALKQIAEAMPTIYCSGPPAGETHVKSCDFQGSELRLIERGLIPAFGLKANKARLLLTLMLVDRASREEIAKEYLASSG